MVDIYVLECEGGNIYVGRTTNGIKRLKQHISGRGAEWTKLHKPTKILDYYENAKNSDEKKVTEQLIKKHGATRVRGGPYVKRKMTKAEIKKLEKKVGFKPVKTVKTIKEKKSSYKCGRCGREGHNKTQCYAKTSVKSETVRSKKATRVKKPVIKKCSRCGREGHTAGSCYAKSTVPGFKPKKPPRS